MSRSLKNSLQSLKKWVFQSDSRVTKIANGQGTPGTGVAPAQSGNNDKKIGSRLDNGETVLKDGKEYKRYKFQVNKGAEDKTLKELADKDSHKVYAHADMPIGEVDKRKAVENLFEDLEKVLKN
ncbi:hypothetical protein PMIN06_009056 [Paraphaeosphaeria minitans]|uniref:Uncharacterized protein n=1 Tax=Paraphaeosphaeria minitans TaxID=565426 RepID=A0A9P6KKD5_9PLEO|nr:hypothetical protein PMIN01_11227 [Paraphaeosphaeria minitans]